MDEQAKNPFGPFFDEIRKIVKEEIRGETVRLGGLPSEDRLVDAEEAARLLGTSPGWLYKNARKLPFTVKLHAKMLRFSHAGIQRYIAAKTVKPGT